MNSSLQSSLSGLSSPWTRTPPGGGLVSSGFSGLSGRRWRGVAGLRLPHVAPSAKREASPERGSSARPLRAPWPAGKRRTVAVRRASGDCPPVDGNQKTRPRNAVPHDPGGNFSGASSHATVKRSLMAFSFLPPALNAVCRGGRPVRSSPRSSVGVSTLHVSDSRSESSAI